MAVLGGCVIVMVIEEFDQAGGEGKGRDVERERASGEAKILSPSKLKHTGE